MIGEGESKEVEEGALWVVRRGEEEEEEGVR